MLFFCSCKGARLFGHRPGGGHCSVILAEVFSNHTIHTGECSAVNRWPQWCGVANGVVPRPDPRPGTRPLGRTSVVTHASRRKLRKGGPGKEWNVLRVFIKFELYIYIF